jgi:hypothetical protein
MLDAGLRVGEVVALEKADVNFDPANGARFACVRIGDWQCLSHSRLVLLDGQFFLSPVLRLNIALRVWARSRISSAAMISVCSTSEGEAEANGLNASRSPSWLPSRLLVASLSASNSES